MGEHKVQLKFFLTGDSYRLSVSAEPGDPARCCVFADGMEEAFVSTGNPHKEVLYYRLPAELADKGHVEFGTIYIALEDLR
ncbi:hypothetical protein [Sinorhizobium americanum]|uniref:Uncharacterized protein n=1 Tax=Sinorhizobium americanum TaxID=194963 RepID=A0A1L3LNA5_9HYPH|nr:hypothetical protein [Sinorhizobium americanum]APG84915.1 hypothetical protein SAMCCGM7_Ch2170 [Sinorhizobium americanum CCGM7]APG91561.1 hypothetical protein SAMCFNEI73_Ch2278 [Sinorhizobium americanum]